MANFSVFIDEMFGVFTPCRFWKCQNGIVPNSAIRRWSHICKKGNTRRPLAFTFDRVPFPVEYIRGPVEWEEMNARSLPQRSGITAENNNSSPLNFSSYLHERMSTSLLPIKECWNTSPTYSTFTDTQHCMPMQSNYMSILNGKTQRFLRDSKPCTQDARILGSQK